MHDYARLALAGVRLLMGTVALVAPARLARRLGVESAEDSPVVYVLRLFGIRTVVLGVELLVPDERLRARALSRGVVIHASDVVTAVLAGAQHQLPRRAATAAALISLTNTALAVAGRPRETAGSKPGGSVWTVLSHRRGPRRWSN